MSSHASTQKEIETILRNAFAPIALEVIDDSAAHARHKEARLTPSAGHFKVVMKSARFDGLTAVKRHRLVYEHLTNLMEHKIHALSLSLYASDEELT